MSAVPEELSTPGRNGVEHPPRDRRRPAENQRSRGHGSPDPAVRDAYAAGEETDAPVPRPAMLFGNEAREIADLPVDDLRVPDELRPLPPPGVGTATSRRLDRLPVHRPVYDPFRARRRQIPEWQVRYTTLVVLTDLLAALAAGGLARALPLPGSGGWVSLVVAVAVWPGFLLLAGSYAERRQGTGADEYRRVVVAALAVLAVLAVLGVLLDHHLDRPVLAGIPLATLLTLIGRMANRRRLHRARRRGLMVKDVVVVGREVAVVELVRRLRRDPTVGLRVVGACVPQPDEVPGLVGEGIPVLGSLTEAAQALDDVRADAVLVASASETGARYLRELAWRLEGTRIEVLVDPGVIEVADNRLQVRPTVSMPLLQLREPEFRGHNRALKSALDWLGAAALLLLAVPLFAVIVPAIRLTSPGPALYRQRRIGKRGHEFDLLKFRSMVDGAPPDVELMALNECNEVQFKMRADPRVTRVGRFLRRWSLDELPQLLNVLKGEMSLVGPRPHVWREVEQYGSDMHRRLLVKPGLTGLWQVCGRSNLSWEEAVELDVRYVENWSIGLDLTILWRTVRAVLGKSGAY